MIKGGESHRLFNQTFKLFVRKGNIQGSTATDKRKEQRMIKNQKKQAMNCSTSLSVSLSSNVANASNGHSDTLDSNSQSQSPVILFEQSSSQSRITDNSQSQSPVVLFEQPMLPPPPPYSATAGPAFKGVDVFQEWQMLNPDMAADVAASSFYEWQDWLNSQAPDPPKLVREVFQDWLQFQQQQSGHQSSSQQ
jgi:hypothetical protein